MTRTNLNTLIKQKFQDVLQDTSTIKKDMDRLYTSWFQALVTSAKTRKLQEKMMQQPVQEGVS